MANSDVTGYRTHVRGALKPVVNSLSIVLYNNLNFSQDSPYRKISIYNMSAILETLKNSSIIPSAQINRKAIEGESLEEIPFKYKTRQLKKSIYNSNPGFNVIIYLDWKGDAVGYTEFNMDQGIYNDLDILLQFEKSILKSENEIDVVNSLAPVLSVELAKSVSNLSDLNEYTTSSIRILKSVSEIEKRSYYSDTLDSLMSGSKIPIYVPGVNMVSDLYNPATRVGDEEYYKQGIGIDVNVNPYLYTGFNNFSIGLYNGELALYMVEEGRNDGKYRYCVCGVGSSTLSIFSNPKFYNNIQDLGYSIFPNPPQGKTIVKVEYGAGGYFVCLDSEGKNILFDVRTESWIIPYDESTDSGLVFVDPLDISGRVVNVKRYTVIEDLCRDWPVISNLWLTLNPYSSYEILRIIGSWVILKGTIYVNGVKTETYYISSPLMSIQLSESELDAVIPINDSTILIRNTYQGEEENEPRNYYTLYAEMRTATMTEIERAKVEDLDLTLYNDLVWLPDSEEYKEAWQNEYEAGLISIIYPLNQSINKTALNKYRRSILPRDEHGNLLKSVPDIIGSFGGLMFYLDQDKETLKYL